MKKMLGIEFGSTRIKAVLADENGKVLASGAYGWENRLLSGGVWSYRLEDALKGMQAAYAELKAAYRKATRKTLDALDAIGISGMMHGYLPFDARGKQLAPFRTWRCTITAEASEKLTKAFNFTIPQRWSAAHLYQRVLDGGAELKNLSFLTTLAGWIHYKLTDEKVLGLGEASGMFPVDPATRGYDAKMARTFDRLAAKKGKFPWNVLDVLPRPLPAGECAGTLTEAGARLLDPSGDLAPGALAAPPEGDVQTGMAATNTVRPGTANISAGTSAFAVVALAKPLAKRHPEIDVCVSPTGAQVAMSHANTCTSDINAWVALLGGDYDRLFKEALKGAPDCGGVVSVPFFGGEPVVGMTQDGVSARHARAGRRLHARELHARAHLLRVCGRAHWPRDPFRRGAEAQGHYWTRWHLQDARRGAADSRGRRQRAGDLPGDGWRRRRVGHGASRRVRARAPVGKSHMHAGRFPREAHLRGREGRDAQARARRREGLREVS